MKEKLNAQAETIHNMVSSLAGTHASASSEKQQQISAAYGQVIHTLGKWVPDPTIGTGGYCLVNGVKEYITEQQCLLRDGWSTVVLQKPAALVPCSGIERMQYTAFIQFHRSAYLHPEHDLGERPLHGGRHWPKPGALIASGQDSLTVRTESDSPDFARVP
jgi:hypothetical protein